MDSTLTQEEIAHYIRRLKDLEDQRKKGWESHWKDLAKNFLPRRARFLDAGEPTNEGAVINMLQSGVGIMSLRTLANGMQSGLTSPARPWFSLGLTNKAVADTEQAKLWLHDTYEKAERYQGGNPAGSVFLDCSLTYEGEPRQTITGLEHLENKTVGIFAEGAVQSPRVVRGGQIVLDHPASLVTVGLLYTADLETMPVEIVGGDGTSVALKKTINVADILFRESLAVKVGLTFAPDKMQDVKWRTAEPYGKPPAPFSGLKQVTMPGLAENIVTVCIRSDMPTPVTVLAVVSRIQVNQ
jgi:hypothetical protein